MFTAGPSSALQPLALSVPAAKNQKPLSSYWGEAVRFVGGAGFVDPDPEPPVAVKDENPKFPLMELLPPCR